MSQKNISYNKRSKYLLLITSIQLLIINCLKDYYSLPDLPGYALAFEHVARNGYDIQWNTGMKASEPGWIVFNIFLSNLYSDPWVLFAFVGGIVILGHFRTYIHYSTIPWLSAYLFLCTVFCQSLYVIRQHVAIALCLLTIPYILQRKFIPFLLVVIVAALIHNTAIIFVLAYWAYSLNVNCKLILFFICTACLSYVFLSKILINVMITTNFYTAYVDGEQTNATGFFISLCVLVLALYSIPLKKMQNELKLFFVMSCIATCINLGGMGVPVTSRLNAYFTVFSILLIPHSVSYLSKKLQLVVITLVMLAYMFFSFSSISYLNGAKNMEFLVYKSI